MEGKAEMPSLFGEKREDDIIQKSDKCCRCFRVWSDYEKNTNQGHLVLGFFDREIYWKYVIVEYAGKSISLYQKWRWYERHKNVLEFIDSPDIWTFYQKTVFTPVQQAVFEVK